MMKKIHSVLFLGSLFILNLLAFILSRDKFDIICAYIILVILVQYMSMDLTLEKLDKIKEAIERREK